MTTILDQTQKSLQDFQMLPDETQPVHSTRNSGQSSNKVLYSGILENIFWSKPIK